MFNENWMNELEFHANPIRIPMTTLKFGDKEIIAPDVSSLVIKLITYINGYGLVFGAYLEDSDLISKIAELSISSDEFETIKTNRTKLSHEDFRQAIQNKFNLDMMIAIRTIILIVLKSCKIFLIKLHHNQLSDR